MNNYVTHDTGVASAQPNLPGEVCLYLTDRPTWTTTRDVSIFAHLTADQAEELARDLKAAARETRTKKHARMQTKQGFGNDFSRDLLDA